jgi:CRISPR type III-B/RAMP module-associated protein Cmr3
MTVDLQVRLEPVEPLLFGDSRSARIGEDHALADQDPTPPTFYGAIGARLAGELDARDEASWGETAKEVLGPFRPGLETGPDSPDTAQLLGYALTDAQGRRWYPKPHHVPVEQIGGRRFALEPWRPVNAVEEEATKETILTSLPQSLSRLAPTQDPGRRVEEVEAPLWVEEGLLSQILAASTEVQEEDWDHGAQEAESFYRKENRLGLEISNLTHGAVAGRLFSRPYRRFLGETSLDGCWGSAGYTAWYRLLDLAGRKPESWDGSGFLGGDRSRAKMSFEKSVDPPLAHVLEEVLAAAGDSRGFLVYLLTPAAVRNREIPGFGSRRPCGAGLGRPYRLSGWRGAASSPGPRALRTVLPAGSVLFFRWGNGEPDAASRQQLLRNGWLEALDPGLAATGLGRVLLGVWR